MKYINLLFFLVLLFNCSSNSDDNTANPPINNITNPSNISGTAVSDISATITWSSISNSTSYSIQYGLTGFSLGSGQSVNTTNSNYTLTGLSPQTSYDYYIQAAFTGNENSDWIGPNSFNTYQECFNPINLNSLKLSNTKIEILWDSQNNIDNYEIEYGLDGFTLGSGSTENVQGSDYIIQNLLPDTQYNFYIRAKCAESYYGDWLGPIFERTAYTCNTAPQDLEVNVTDLGSNTEVLLYWSPLVADPWSVDPFPSEVEYGPVGFQLGSGTIIEVWNNSGVVVGNLTPSTSYDIYVRGKCGQEYFSPYAGPVSFTTLD